LENGLQTPEHRSHAYEALILRRSLTIFVALTGKIIMRFTSIVSRL
jgi:hypothetical protein